jgi:hypothetical protein
MSRFTKIASIALVASTLAGATLTSTAAEARGGHFWGGVAAGAVGGLILGSALSQPAYAGPSYYAAPAPVYYAPSCHKEWRTDYYGNAYKVRVCD